MDQPELSITRRLEHISAVNSVADWNSLAAQVGPELLLTICEAVAVSAVQNKPASVLVSPQGAVKSITEQELRDYNRLHSWRAAWGRLANKHEPGRLQSRQDRIEHRATLCNIKIRRLMRTFDSRVGVSGNQN